jgi:acylphosphatase
MRNKNRLKMKIRDHQKMRNIMRQRVIIAISIVSGLTLGIILFINLFDSRKAYAVDLIYGVGSGDGFAFKKVGGPGTEVPLPIELLSFEAKLDNQSVIVTWKTASEINNDYFSVERSSNGIDFEIIKTVRGAGNSTVVNAYSYTDHSILPGTSYYRLKQTDYDGHFEYFNIESINNKGINNSTDGEIEIISVFPNPFSNSFTAEIKSKSAGAIEIQIIDMNGKLINKEQIETGETKTVYNFQDERNIIPGIYFVRVMKDGEYSRAFKIIKK